MREACADTFLIFILIMHPFINERFCQLLQVIPGKRTLQRAEQCLHFTFQNCKAWQHSLFFLTSLQKCYHTECSRGSVLYTTEIKLANYFQKRHVTAYVIETDRLSSELETLSRQSCKVMCSEDNFKHNLWLLQFPACVTSDHLQSQTHSLYRFKYIKGPKRTDLISL